MAPRGPRDCGTITKILDRWFESSGKRTGECIGCQTKDIPGIYMPTGSKLYCRKCWCDYLKQVKDDDEWSQWIVWTPSYEEYRERLLKDSLRALGEIGATITFPPTLSRRDRAILHGFCEQEGKQYKLSHESYGEAPNRFLSVSNLDKDCRIAEARAILQKEVPNGHENAAGKPQQAGHPAPDDPGATLVARSVL
eukprot:gnl/TRDRNA2_/TRDRNA2_164246_c0_seq2.p1 gnl/TRDRNA2_/TRDRNA2_164246_c0~~gnl/TRDRNA2_/TRDRNA2_164246_c0_seq2.p1  ORF type:complete len:213 (+),score=14.95 gnl/TRDRNA2_/TRDRNA2_164246_c0_seq2:55-639(+)